MPYSDTSFDDVIESLLLEWSYRYYLDIGPGAGKYGKLVRQRFPSAYIEALEPDVTYITDFNLTHIYDHVVSISATEFVDSNPDYHTECVIIGDSIEHLKKSAGIDLLNYLMYRSKTIVVVFPVKYVQYSWHGHTNEAHLSVWGREDFRGMKHRWYAKSYMRLVIIDGFLKNPDIVTNPVTKEILQIHRPVAGKQGI